MNNDSHLPTGARHFFANVCSPPPHGRDKSSPYNTGDKSLHEQFIARFVGAQFHCARGGNGASQKNDAHTIENVKFLKGIIEAIPLVDQSVDVIISNCVVNLSTDKSQVMREAYRVLT